MKKLIMIILLATIAIGCNDTGKEEKDKKVRYTQDSDEINTLKAAIADYEKADWEAMKKHYVDTAQIFHNSTQAKRIGEIVKQHEESIANLDSYGFVADDEEFEMVLTDDGNTWVNFWGDWKATPTGSDKEVIIPVHLTAQFKNGKIVREHGYWNNEIMMMAMQEIDTTQANPE